MFSNQVLPEKKSAYFNVRYEQFGTFFLIEKCFIRKRNLSKTNNFFVTFRNLKRKLARTFSKT